MSNDFNWSNFSLNSVKDPVKQVIYIDIESDCPNDFIRMPLMIVRGCTDGPTMTVLGGVHGDEYEGPFAVRELFKKLDPASLNGTFIGLPQSNPPATEAGTRKSPIDNLNLARVFPGNLVGTITDKIAYFISKQLIDNSDFLIDLHSSGTHISTPTLVGYDASDKGVINGSKECALAFGSNVIWGHDTLSHGRSISYANSINIPWIYTECSGGGWLHIKEAGLYVKGVLNVMRNLKMIEGVISSPPPEFQLLGDGDMEESIAASVSGYLVPKVDMLSRVKKAQLLGEIIGPANEVLEKIKSPHDGVIVLIRRSAAVIKGESTFLVTGELS